MIQRIQSLLLLIAAAISIAINFFTIGTISYAEPGLPQMVAEYTAFSLSIPSTGKVLHYTYWIAVLWIVSAVLSMITIFMYKNRQRQIRLNGVNMLVMLAALVTMLFIYPNMVFNTDVVFNRWILLSLIPAVCLFFANKFIKKDEAKVRAADRLR